MTGESRKLYCYTNPKTKRIRSVTHDLTLGLAQEHAIMTYRICVEISPTGDTPWHTMTVHPAITIGDLATDTSRPRTRHNNDHTTVEGKPVRQGGQNNPHMIQDSHESNQGTRSLPVLFSVQIIKVNLRPHNSHFSHNHSLLHVTTQTTQRHNERHKQNRRPKRSEAETVSTLPPER